MKKLLSILIALMGIGFQVGFGQCPDSLEIVGTPQFYYRCNSESDSVQVEILNVSNVVEYSIITDQGFNKTTKDGKYVVPKTFYYQGLRVKAKNECGVWKDIYYGFLPRYDIGLRFENICPTTEYGISSYGSFVKYSKNDVLIDSGYNQLNIPVDDLKINDIVKVELNAGKCFKSFLGEISIVVDTVKAFLAPDIVENIVQGNVSSTFLGKGTEVSLTNLVKNLSGGSTTDWELNGVIKARDTLEYSTKIFYDSKVRVITTPSCGHQVIDSVSFSVFNKTIEGQVFYDLNQNCQKDSNEKWANNILLKVSPLDVYTTTNDSGYYYTSVPVGEYELLPIPSFKNQTVFAATCSENGVELTNQKPIVSGVDFGIEVDSLHYVNISASSGRIRPGFTGSYSILLTNYGAYNESGEVYFVPDSRLEEITSVPSASRIEGDTLFWDFSNWKSGQRANFAKVGFRLPANIDFLGDTIVSTAGVLVANNKSDSPIKEVRTVVTGSYDPNDKQVVQTEVLEEQYKLDYKIRFQNTGTDTAFMVVVRDTISSLYDLSTLEVGAASHDYDFSIEPNNVLQWVFRDILLPDSTTNEPESNGFLTFSIERKKDLFIGDSIVNKAEIYFDYNPEIITNWARTDIVAPKVTSTETSFVEESSIVYPNPSSGTITLSSPANGVLSVHGLSGMLVKQIAVEQGLSTLNLSELDRGIYILELQTEKGRMQSKLVIE